MAARAVCSQRFCSSGRPAAAAGSGSRQGAGALARRLPVLKSAGPLSPLRAGTPMLHISTALSHYSNCTAQTDCKGKGATTSKPGCSGRGLPEETCAGAQFPQASSCAGGQPSSDKGCSELTRQPLLRTQVLLHSALSKKLLLRTGRGNPRCQ